MREGEHQLHVAIPQEICVDFRGHRLTAQPLLNLEDEILYGSGDAGRNVFCDAKVHPIVEAVAAKLHLATHQVGRSDKFLACAGDIEFKMTKPTGAGTKRTGYMLDLSRGMPPEAFAVTRHLDKVGSAVFSRMLRPELLQTLKAKTDIGPLSPDHLTGFGRGAKDDADATANTVRFDRLAGDATRYLLETVIPDFALELAADSLVDISIGRWAPEMHTRGINMRHLGLVRHELLKQSREVKGGPAASRSRLEEEKMAELQKPEDEKDAALARVAQRMLGEMTARALKSLAR